MWNQYYYQTLSIKKKNMKWKKSENTERKNRKLNIWYTGKVMGMNTING